MSKAQSKSYKLATIVSGAVSYGEDSEAVRVQFSPGLPYDPMTKGCPHRAAWFTEIVIQNPRSHRKEKHLVLCGGERKPDLGYIYAMVKADDVKRGNLKGFAAHLGYKLVDAVANERRALQASARQKLSPEERAAVGLK